jgi:hypothetical protein
MDHWKAKIRLPNGALEEVGVRAGNAMNARAILEQIYGKGSILSGPLSADAYPHALADKMA